MSATGIEGWISQLRKGVMEYCVLLSLRGGETGENYGYRIVQRLRESGMDVGESTVYPILARLVKEGALRVEIREGEGGPTRRCFRLSAAGRARLAAMEAYWPEVGKGIERLRGKGGLAGERRGGVTSGGRQATRAEARFLRE